MLAVSSRKCNVTVWRPSVCPIGILTVTHQGAACDAASVNSCLTLRRTDVLDWFDMAVWLQWKWKAGWLLCRWNKFHDFPVTLASNRHEQTVWNDPLLFEMHSHGYVSTLYTIKCLVTSKTNSKSKYWRSAKAIFHFQHISSTFRWFPIFPLTSILFLTFTGLPRFPD